MRYFLGEGLFGGAVGILPRQFNGFQNLEAENSWVVVAWELGRLRETQVQKLFPSRFITSSPPTRLPLHSISFLPPTPRCLSPPYIFTLQYLTL